jgi:hypothetical protein
MQTSIEAMGGVLIDEKGLTYSRKEPAASHVFTRATYTNISENRFTWQGENRTTARRGEQFMVIEAYRVS